MAMTVPRRGLSWAAVSASQAQDPPAIALTPAPDAPAGSSDPTRRWALAFPDGTARFAGIARPEAESAAPELARMAPDRWDAALVEVALPVILAEGAGPYLLDAGGRIALALAPHPALADAHIAMGEPAPAHRVGLVRRCAGRVWEWLVDAAIAPGDRVRELDRLDAVTDLADARQWEERARRGAG
jgi:hypothetical protein